MSTKDIKGRRSGEEARAQAIEAARTLLLAGGPSAVTLKAVGEKMGVGHANLIHHFGSAAGLQGELMDRMVRDLASATNAKLDDSGGAWTREALIDIAFTAFGPGGASELAAWLALARETGRAKSFAEAVRDLADRLAQLSGNDPAAQAKARAMLLAVTYMAFADGLIGDVLSDILEVPRGLSRELTAAVLKAIIDGGEEA